jgi:hypothetical protein
MKSVIVERGAVNVEALDAALRAALGAATTGYSISGGNVIVHLLDSATAQQENQARIQKLNQARTNYGVNPLDVATYTAQPALIQQLAQKISWLEQEIAALQGG